MHIDGLPVLVIRVAVVKVYPRANALAVFLPCIVSGAAMRYDIKIRLCLPKQCETVRVAKLHQETANFREFIHSTLATPPTNSQTPLCVCHAPLASITPGELSRRQEACVSIMIHSSGVPAQSVSCRSCCPRIQGGQKRRRRRGWFGCVASVRGAFTKLLVDYCKHEVAMLQQGGAAQSCCMLFFQRGSSR